MLFCYFSYLRTKLIELFTIHNQISMQLLSRTKRVLPIIAIIALITISSCGTKKYGCPGHMFTPPTLLK